MVISHQIPKSCAVKQERQSSSRNSAIYTIPNSGNYMPLHPSGRSWEINREQVQGIEIIGKGAFSQVAKATAWNIRADEEYTTVAVKMLKGAVKKF